MSTEIVVTSESSESETPEETGSISESATAASSESLEADAALARAESTESRSGAAANRQREMTTTTLVRLMGLPTAAEIGMLESKIDNLSSKVSTLVAKLERLSGQMPQLFHDFDRTNTQIADLREFTRKALAAVVSHLDTSAQLDEILARGGKPATAGAAASASGAAPQEKKATVLSSE